MSSKPKVLAIASSGGHFMQLMRVMPAFAGCELHVASTNGGLGQMALDQGNLAGLETVPFHKVTEANRWEKLRLIKSLADVGLLVLKLRPDVVISTGAAPGYFAIRAGKLVGAKTIWLDSMANAEALSMSGEMAGKHVSLWLTQWPQLATENGPKYEGSVL